MRYSNIIKKLTKDGYEVQEMCFNYEPCYGVNGTALIDLIDGTVMMETNATYKDVLNQIKAGKSHIYNIALADGTSRSQLSPYSKLG